MGIIIEGKRVAYPGNKEHKDGAKLNLAIFTSTLPEDQNDHLRTYTQTSRTIGRDRGFVIYVVGEVAEEGLWLKDKADVGKPRDKMTHQALFVPTLHLEVDRLEGIMRIESAEYVVRIKHLPIPRQEFTPKVPVYPYKFSR